MHRDRNYHRGQWVYVWRRDWRGARDRTGGPSLSRWVGPGLIALQDGTTVWVSMRGRLWKCAREQIREATNHESLVAELLTHDHLRQLLTDARSPQPKLSTSQQNGYEKRIGIENAIREQPRWKMMWFNNLRIALILFRTAKRKNTYNNQSQDDRFPDDDVYSLKHPQQHHSHLRTALIAHWIWTRYQRAQMRQDFLRTSGQGHHNFPSRHHQKEKCWDLLTSPRRCQVFQVKSQMLQSSLSIATECWILERRRARGFIPNPSSRKNVLIHQKSIMQAFW